MVNPISPTDPLAIHQIGSVLYVDSTRPTAPVSGSGFFGDAMFTYFNGLSEAQKQAIWLRFLELHDLTDPPAANLQNQKLFNDYVVATYRQLESDVVSSENLVLNLVRFSPPTGSFYATVMQAAFSTFSESEQQRIWVWFLQSNGYTTTVPADDAPTHALFVQHLMRTILNNEHILIDIPQLPEIVPPTSGFFGSLFQVFDGVVLPDPQNNNLPGPLSPIALQKIWVRFLLERNTITPNPVDGPTQTAFTNYVLATLQNLILQQGAYSDYAPLQPPTTGVYGDIMQAFFSGMSLQQQQAVWVQFLANNHFTGVVPTDVNTQQDFQKYVGAVFNNLQRNQLSLHEIVKRDIMLKTFETLLAMLLSLQDAIGVQSRNLIFYGTWQQEYTAMMTRVPTYVGQPDDTVHVPATVDENTDFSRFTFGYNNISVEDIAKWWSYNSLVGVNEPFKMSSMATIDIYSADGQEKLDTVPQFELTYTPQNGSTPGKIEWHVNTIGDSITISVPDNPDFPFIFFHDETVATSVVPVGDFVEIPLQPALSTFPNNAQSSLKNGIQSYMTAFKEAFTEAWNGTDPNNLTASLASVNVTNLAAINIDPNSVTGTRGARTNPDTSANSALEIPWLYGYVAPQGTDTKSVKGRLSDSDSKLRAEVNARDQAYIEGIRARRKVVQDQAQQIQSTLDSSRQSVSDQADLLTSILKSVHSMIQSIFR